MPAMAPLEHHSPRFATRAARRIGQGTKNVIARLGRKGRTVSTDDNAFISMTPLLKAIGAALLLVIAIPIVFGLFANGLPKIVNSTRLIATTLTDADWGNDDVNSVSSSMSIVVPLVVLFGTVTFIMGMWYVFEKKKAGA